MNDAAATKLADTQRELARALVSPVVAWPDRLLESVVPGGTLDVAGSLAVYRNGYFARLTEQLGETYQTVWAVIGDERFFALCESYIASHLSSSHNLSDYGRDFAAFLDAGPEAAEAPFLAELARFELVFHDLFHAAGHQGLEARELASLADLGGVKLRLGAAVRLVACRRAVYELFRHRHDQVAPDLDVERPQWVLMFKQAGEVLAREVDEATYAALEAFQEGWTVDDALERAIARDEAFGPAEVARLFEMLARCGLVVSAGR